MRIAFDRFVALTAALAGASAGVSACGSHGANGEFGTGGSGSAGIPGNGGGAGSGAGGTRPGSGSAKSNGSSGGSASTTGGIATSAGSAGEAGEAGSNTTSEGGSGGSPPSAGGANDSSGGTGGASLAGEAGEGGTAEITHTGGKRATGGTAKGGTASVGGAAGEGGAPMGGEAGSDGDQGGEGGASSEACLGDTGIDDCFALDLPSDECPGWSPVAISCYASTGGLRPGALEALGNCLIGITAGACTSEAASATYACEEDVARRACPAPEALDACANGIALQGGGTVASPLVACNDATLTQESCTELLNAVNLSALPEVVTCADPAGEYGGDFSGTCAERLHNCVFPHSWLYAW